MQETKQIEFKETITNTFLKTVSAFSNYDGGVIYFGIDDDAKVVGIENIKQSCLDIENKINDSITPQPDFSIKIEENNTISLHVKSGAHKPYLYKSKAYKRNDTATIEVDVLEFTRLVLEGKNLKFEELPCKNQNLTFNFLKNKFTQILNLEDFNLDTLKTVNLYNANNGYNNAASLFADKNSFPGIDIVKFGENINIIQKRITFENICILEVFDKTIKVFEDYFQYEQIEGKERNIREKIPKEAFREAVANALIHRTWDTEAQIRILMFDDKIEIVSPGGLPDGISEQEYLDGKLSILRNRNLANVFYRLGFVEIFGTGITRIKSLYEKSMLKPDFEISKNTIKIVLPLFETNLNLSDDEHLVYKTLSKVRSKSISEIISDLPFGKSKTTGLLQTLVQKGLVKIEGNGKGTKYSLK